MPAVLFYLLDRHALLAMTRGSKGIFLGSLTTPSCGHPSNGGELGAYPRGIKFPRCEGNINTLYSNKKRGGAPFFIPCLRL